MNRWQDQVQMSPIDRITVAQSPDAGNEKVPADHRQHRQISLKKPIIVAPCQTDAAKPAISRVRAGPDGSVCQPWPDRDPGNRHRGHQGELTLISLIENLARATALQWSTSRRLAK